MSANRLIFLTLAVLLWSTGSFAQTKSKLEKEKQESLRKIRETEKIIKETKSQKQATMGQLTAISKQIEARQDLINSINSELALLDEDIQEKEGVITALEADVEVLKKEYAAMIYSAAKMDNSISKLAFIFSAESFNQMMMRVKYFNQYSDTRKNQLELIDKVKESIEVQRNQLDKKRLEKSTLLNSHTHETNTLTSLKDEKNKVVKELSQKESQLKKELEETKKSLKQLENKIREIIEDERKKAIAAAEAAKKKNAVKKSPAEEKGSSSAFSGNLNKLPWPVSGGTIIRKYGRQKHPVLGIEENNLGVGIQTTKGEQVKAVFAGKVISVAEIPGMNKIVMIQHGDFFTVYARLRKVYVKKDQEVSAKEAIGEVYTNSDEVTQLEFQVWKGNQHQDPEAWLGKR